MDTRSAGQGTLYGVPLGVMIPKHPGDKRVQAQTSFGPVPVPGTGDLYDSLWRMDVAIRHLYDSKGA